MWAETMLVRASSEAAQGEFKAAVRYLQAALTVYPYNGLLKDSLSHYSDKYKRSKIWSDSLTKVHQVAPSFQTTSISWFRSSRFNNLVALSMSAICAAVFSFFLVIGFHSIVGNHYKTHKLQRNNNEYSTLYKEIQLSIRKSYVRDKEIFAPMFQTTKAASANSPSTIRAIVADTNTLIAQKVQTPRGAKYIGTLLPATNILEARKICQLLTRKGAVDKCDAQSVAFLTRGDDFSATLTDLH